MKILIVGGTGTVGSEVARLLARDGRKVSVLTRSAGKPVPEGAKAVVGDLARPETLPRAFDGAEAVFLATALAQDETAQGLNAVQAAAEAGVRRIVYMSVHNAREAAHIPHFASKLPIEDAAMHSGMEWTILGPNNFYQNDYWWKDAILNGVYPQPLGSAGTSRVDVRDIGEAALNALTKPGHAGKTYPLVGPQALTGEAMAWIYSQHLGRQVRYAGDDLEAFAAGARTMLPDWLVHDFTIMYEYFQKHGLRASAEDLEMQAGILGHPPRNIGDFVAETVRHWKG